VSATTDPAGVVVVGASSDPVKPSGRALDYLRRYGFAGEVWVVNPRHSDIAGFPCVPSIDEVPPGRAQAAIVNLPAPGVTSALRRLDAVGVRSAIVIGSGFEERGSAPREELLDYLHDPQRSMRVIGPNCVGTMSVGSGSHLNFSSVLRSAAPRAGGVALVTQSGATGNGILMSLIRRGAGVAHWFSTGDELDVGALEVIAGLLPRPEVRSVGLFLEAVTDIDWLPEVRRLMDETGKPVYVVKIADSDLGQLAAGGHTGRVVGSGDVSRAVLSHAGFVHVESVAELADSLVIEEIVGALPVPARVSAVSVSGASGVILADQVRASSTLALPAPSARSTEAAVRVSGGRLTGHNPLDVPFLGETETFAGIVSELAEDPDNDVVLAVESSLAHDRDQLADALSSRSRESAPVVLTHLSEDDDIAPDLVVKLADARVAVVPTPERAARAVARAARRARRSTVPPPAVAVVSPPVAGLEALAAVLPSDLPWAEWVVTSGLDGARAHARRFGFPVAVKAAGRTIAHRSELGAVAVVHGEDELAPTYERVAQVCEEHGDAVVVQRGVPAGHEVLVAVLRDPEYGPAALVRPGGVLAELLDDQVVLWHGWSPAERRDALADSRLGILLAGYRGRRGGDLDALHALVESVLRQFQAGQLEFVEFNPVVVTENGAAVIDAVGSLTTSPDENGDRR
jgi:acyl-CoA synthetase (NDP forming)